MEYCVYLVCQASTFILSVYIKWHYSVSTNTAYFDTTYVRSTFSIIILPTYYLLCLRLVLAIHNRRCCFIAWLTHHTHITLWIKLVYMPGFYTCRLNALALLYLYMCLQVFFQFITFCQRFLVFCRLLYTRWPGSGCSHHPLNYIHIFNLCIFTLNVHRTQSYYKINSFTFHFLHTFT